MYDIKPKNAMSNLVNEITNIVHNVVDVVSKAIQGHYDGNTENCKTSSSISTLDGVGHDSTNKTQTNNK